MYSTIRILRSEHTSLVSLLRMAMSLVAKSREQGKAPDFTSLRAMLFYIAEFPERHHHRKESALLFPRLRARTPLARALLDQLDDDHVRGEARIRELEHSLVAFEMLGETRRAVFERALARYVDFYLVHMSLEEHEIFPLADRVLHARDWEELDEEFGAGLDALTGADPEEEYVELFARIRRHLPELPRDGGELAGLSG
jgi:hemerythrin-like domain-containing protein